MKKQTPKKSPKRRTGTITLHTIAESIDDLAAITAQGFKNVDIRFEQVETRIDNLEARVEGIDHKVSALHSEVLSMNYDHKKVKARLENVELRVFGSIQDA